MSPDSANPFDWTTFAENAMAEWEKNMTSWWDDVLESPDFLKAMGTNLSGYARARKKYEEAIDQSLHQMHIPTRADLTQLTRICTLLEERLLSMEDTLLEMNDKMGELEKHALQARIDAAETRVEMQEKLAQLEAKLAGTKAPTKTPAKTPVKTPVKATAAKATTTAKPKAPAKRTTSRAKKPTTKKA